MAFRKADVIWGDENEEFREEPSDTSPIKEEMEYEFVAPTNSGYEYDPLAIDNTPTDADPVFYQPPVKTIKVEEPVALAVRMEPCSSLATQHADEPVPFRTERPRGDEALRTSCAVVDPLSSPMSDVNDEVVILCSSDEEEPEIQALFPIDAPLCVNLLKSTPGVSSFYTDPLAVAPAGVKTESETPNSCGPTGYFWTSEELPNREIPFTGKPGLKLRPTGSTPFDYFKLVLDDEFCHIFMAQANKCAFKMAEGNSRLSKKKNLKTLITRWKPICMKEFETWLAILIHMGGIQCPSFSHYWSTELLHQSTFFTKVSPLMSKDRWIGIMQTLHFLKVSVDSKPVEPFFKINPLIQWFNRRMKMVYEPGKELCLEEPVVLWQGGLIPWSCLRDKKHGIKLHSVTEPEGLILRFSSDKMDISDESTSCKVVNSLLADFEGKGHSVFMENCYNSVDLCHELLARQLHTSGPLPSLRKNIPEQIVDSKPEPGHVVYTRSNHGVSVMKWRDDNDQLLFISSEFSPCLVETSYKSDREQKPEAVAVFNKYLSGFGKRFRDLTEYRAVQKHTNNHVKIGVHIIEMAVYNAFVLYKKYSTNINLDFAGFRAELVRKLCVFRKQFSPCTPVNVVPPSNPDVWHRIEHTEYGTFRYGKQGRKGRAFVNCKQCLRKSKKTKVTTFCVVCPEHPGLCVGDCFVQWHLHLGFSNVKEGIKPKDHTRQEER